MRFLHFFRMKGGNERSRHGNQRTFSNPFDDDDGNMTMTYLYLSRSLAFYCIVLCHCCLLPGFLFIEKGQDISLDEDLTQDVHTLVC